MLGNILELERDHSMLYSRQYAYSVSNYFVIYFKRRLQKTCFCIDDLILLDTRGLTRYTLCPDDVQFDITCHSHVIYQKDCTELTLYAL